MQLWPRRFEHALTSGCTFENSKWETKETIPIAIGLSHWIPLIDGKINQKNKHLEQWMGCQNIFIFEMNCITKTNLGENLLKLPLESTST
jgi:hypothetical protein